MKVNAKKKEGEGEGEREREKEREWEMGGREDRRERVREVKSEKREGEREKREREEGGREEERESVFGTFVVKSAPNRHREEEREREGEGGREVDGEGEGEEEGEGGGFGTFVVMKSEKKAKKERPKSLPPAEVYGTFVVSDAQDPDDVTSDHDSNDAAESQPAPKKETFQRSKTSAPSTSATASSAAERGGGGLAYRQPEKWESAILALQKGVWDDSCDNDAFKRYKRTRKHLTDMSWKNVTPRQNLAKNLEWGLEEGETLILQTMNVRLFMMGRGRGGEVEGGGRAEGGEADRIQTFVSGCLAVTNRNLKHYSAGM